MIRRRFGGIRLRLALAICLTTLIAVVGSFLALAAGTEADLRDRIDSDLIEQNGSFDSVIDSQRVRTREQLRRATNRFLSSQRYDSAGQILLIEVNGYPLVTNQQPRIERALKREEDRRHGGDEDSGRSGGSGSNGGGNDSGSGDSGSGDSGGGDSGSGDSGGGDSGSGDSGSDESGAIGLPFEGRAYAQSGLTLLAAPAGFSTIETETAGRLRVLTRPIVSRDGRRLGTFRAAEPLASVELTREGLRNTFLLVGLTALVLAITVAGGLASVITAPLRNMASFASAIGAGDLRRRLRQRRTGDEVDVLADSFNAMLDRLEEAFKRQQDFVSDASHELRTPLTVLRGQIDVLRRNGDDPATREKTLRTVLGEIDRMNRLVEDMLVLARADAENLVSKRPLELDDFMQDLERDLPLLGARSYSVACTATGLIDADPDRLEQVFRNVVRNAVKHTDPDGKIRIEVAPTDGNVTFSVTDDGPGIPADQLPRIFDRFHRTDDGRTRDQGGSGLGLAIARAIVEAHGGRIWAESEARRGTTISFELPGRRQRAAQPRVPTKR